MENIEQNIKLQFAIEDHTTLLKDVQMSLQDEQSIINETVVSLKLEQIKRDEFISSIPTYIETVLSKETNDYLEDFGKDIKWKNGKPNCINHIILVKLTKIRYANKISNYVKLHFCKFYLHIQGLTQYLHKESNTNSESVYLIRKIRQPSDITFEFILYNNLINI